MTDLPFPLSGTTLILGPSQVGKTRLTAQALETWVDRYGAAEVVVLEFAPEVERHGQLVGGRLDRFTSIPDEAWHGVLDARAPRLEGETDAESVALARGNAERAAQLLDEAPPARAVFVNDATIPVQHDSLAADRLTAYCDRADCVVMNAFESDEFGTADPVSRQERAALETFRQWADRTVSLA
jgi:hypothetical protein